MKNNIKKIRTDMGLTQGALAAQSGISRQSLNAIENGHKIPSLLNAANIANALKHKIDEVFCL